MRNQALRVAAVTALSLASIGYAGTSRATGWPVVDITAIMNALQSYGEQIARWEETARHYTEVIAHYKGVVSHYAAQVAFWQEQLNKLARLELDLFEIEQDFKEVSDNYGVDVMCPGAESGGLLDRVTSALTTAINPDSDVVGEQKKICMKIVRTQNKKYNDTVAYLKSLRKSTADFVELTRKRIEEVKNSPGMTAGLAAETSRYSANMQLAKDKWHTSVEQLDVQLGLLNQQQMVLSKRALNGKSSLWGTLVNTAVLQQALSISH